MHFWLWFFSGLPLNSSGAMATWEGWRGRDCD